MQNYINLCRLLAIDVVTITSDQKNQTETHDYPFCRYLYKSNSRPACLPKKKELLQEQASTRLTCQHGLEYMLINLSAEEKLLCGPFKVADSHINVEKIKKSLKTDIDIGKALSDLATLSPQQLELLDRLCKQFHQHTQATQSKEIIPFFDELMNNIPAIITVKDAKDLTFQFFNRAGELFFNVDTNHIIGKKAETIFPANMSIASTQRDKAAIKNWQIVDIPQENMKDLFGQDKVFHTKKIPFTSEAGKHLLSVSVDVTNASQAQEKLYLAEQQYVAITEAQSEYICRFSPTGNISFVNHGFAQLLGKEPKQIENHDFFSLLPDNTQKTYQQKVDHLEVAEPNFTIEYRYFTLDGQQLWLEWHNYGLFDTYGKLNEIQAIGRNITSRKKAEEALRESETRYRNIFNAVNDCIFIINQEGLIFTTNQAATDAFGYSPTEFLGLPIQTIIHSEHQREFNDAFQEGIKNHILPVTTIKAKTQKGVIAYFEIHGNSIQLASQSHIIMVAKDISHEKQKEEEKKQLELQLAQSQKMEAIGRLAGGVAHDFNNILTCISGNVALALMDTSTNDPLFETLEEINHASKRAADLTRQLLVFSRKQIYEPIIINLNDLIRNLRKMLIRLLGEDVDLLLNLYQDPCFIRVDPGQFEQVVVNLCVNARDAMEDGGQLKIHVQPCTIADADLETISNAIPGDYISMEVQDNGHGIEPEVFDHIFEPFYTTKPKDRGTGLGLATSYGIVEQHGGFIHVLSEINHGSTFTIYMPHQKDAVKPEVRVSKSTKLPKGNETILLVEDEQDVRGIAVRILKRQGYSVISASNSGEAIAFAEKYLDNINLLVTDVIMPGMNGKELADRLVEMKEDLVVLFTSGYSEEVLAPHGMLDESLNFLAKPYEPKDLAIKVREVLDKQRNDTW